MFVTKRRLVYRVMNRRAIHILQRLDGGVLILLMSRYVILGAGRNGLVEPRGSTVCQKMVFSGR